VAKRFADPRQALHPVEHEPSKRMITVGGGQWNAQALAQLIDRVAAINQ
jgi:hypothetical protein